MAAIGASIPGFDLAISEFTCSTCGGAIPHGDVFYAVELAAGPDSVSVPMCLTCARPRLLDAWRRAHPES